MRGRHAVHVVLLAGGGSYLMKARTVPRGDSALEVRRTGGQHVVAFAEHVIKRRIAVAGSWLRARRRIRNGRWDHGRRSGRNAVIRYRRGSRREAAGKPEGGGQPDRGGEEP